MEHITKQILFAHFEGRVSPLQRKQIEDWLAEPTHVNLYYQYLAEWERANLQYQADDEQAWQHTRQQIGTLTTRETIATETTDSPFRAAHVQPFWPRMGQIAATVGGLALLATLLYANRSWFQYRTITAAFGEIRRETLPDGSVVTLNTNSSLRIPRFGFGQQWYGNPEREVFLTGEALFSVVHTKSHQPFIVRTPNALAVRVLGTEFSVCARQRRTNVVLKRGKVEVAYSPKAQPARQIALRPGDWLAINRAGAMQVKHTTHPEYQSAWAQHRFVFDENTLTDIADIIQDNYGYSVNITAPGLASRPVSGSFQANSAEELAAVIAELLGVNYRIENKQLTFY